MGAPRAAGPSAHLAQSGRRRDKIYSGFFLAESPRRHQIKMYYFLHRKDILYTFHTFVGTSGPQLEFQTKKCDFDRTVLTPLHKPMIGRILALYRSPGGRKKVVAEPASQSCRRPLRADLNRRRRTRHRSFPKPNRAYLCA